MFENMTVAVAFAMHEDRQAMAKRNLRLTEAERATKGRRASERRFGREAIAKGLMTLAGRLAPSIAMQDARGAMPAMQQAAGS